MDQVNFELRVFLALTKGVIQTQGNQALAACSSFVHIVMNHTLFYLAVNSGPKPCSIV